MKKTLIILPILTLIGLIGFRLYNKFTFNIGCKQYLKRAAHANTVPVAQKELKTALKYLEANNMTTGYTSVLYNTPNEDLGFFYENLKGAYKELCTVSDSTSSLESSNLLLKLRDSLTDGNVVILPRGIEQAPNNKLQMWIGIISGLILVLTSISGHLKTNY